MIIGIYDRENRFRGYFARVQREIIVFRNDAKQKVIVQMNFSFKNKKNLKHKSSM
jgi:hypothetical protein